MPSISLKLTSTWWRYISPSIQFLFFLTMLKVYQSFHTISILPTKAKSLSVLPYNFYSSYSYSSILSVLPYYVLPFQVVNHKTLDTHNALELCLPSADYKMGQFYLEHVRSALPGGPAQCEFFLSPIKGRRWTCQALRRLCQALMACARKLIALKLEKWLQLL